MDESNCFGVLLFDDITSDAVLKCLLTKFPDVWKLYEAGGYNDFEIVLTSWIL